MACFPLWLVIVIAFGVILQILTSKWFRFIILPRNRVIQDPPLFFSPFLNTNHYLLQPISGPATPTIFWHKFSASPRRDRVAILLLANTTIFPRRDSYQWQPFDNVLTFRLKLNKFYAKTHYFLSARSWVWSLISHRLQTSKTWIHILTQMEPNINTLQCNYLWTNADVSTSFGHDSLTIHTILLIS